MKTIVVPVMMSFCLLPIFGQTVRDIEKKYGQRENVYSISEHIWMTPSYGSDGQLYVIRLFPKRVNAEVNFIGPFLLYTEIRDVLNSLVPPENRGPKCKSKLRNNCDRRAGCLDHLPL